MPKQQPNTRPTRPATPPGKRTGGHEWQGDAVDQVSRTGEEPELAASRAEGNAPLSVEEARSKDAAATDPATFGLGGRQGAGRGRESSRSRDDDAESEEAKRQAAAEAHAEGPPKHSPHGRL